jgi:hypothetical protein
MGLQLAWFYHHRCLSSLHFVLTVPFYSYVSVFVGWLAEQDYCTYFALSAQGLTIPKFYLFIFLWHLKNWEATETHWIRVGIINENSVRIAWKYVQEEGTRELLVQNKTKPINWHTQVLNKTYKQN